MLDCGLLPPNPIWTIQKETMGESKGRLPGWAASLGKAAGGLVLVLLVVLGLRLLF